MARWYGGDGDGEERRRPSLFCEEKLDASDTAAASPQDPVTPLELRYPRARFGKANASVVQPFTAITPITPVPVRACGEHAGGSVVRPVVVRVKVVDSRERRPSGDLMIGGSGRFAPGAEGERDGEGGTPRMLRARSEASPDRPGCDGGPQSTVIRGNGGTRLSIETLSRYFHLPSDEACEKLGIGKTVLKRECRAHNIGRWPYRKIHSVSRLIEQIEADDASNNDKGEHIALALDELKEFRDKLLGCEEVDARLEATVKKMQQNFFKAAHKDRKRRRCKTGSGCNEGKLFTSPVAVLQSKDVSGDEKSPGPEARPTMSAKKDALMFLADVAAYINGSHEISQLKKKVERGCLVDVRDVGTITPPLKSEEPSTKMARHWAFRSPSDGDDSVGELENVPERPGGFEVENRLSPFTDLDNLERASMKRKSGAEMTSPR